MLKKKLISLGIAAIFTLSSLTVPVAADEFKFEAKDNKLEIKFNSGKGNGKVNKNDWKKIEFSDLSDVQWALDAIEKVTIKGILNGIGQNKFAPKGNVTQLEAIASVLKLTGDSELAKAYDGKMHPLYKGIRPLWGLGYIYLAIENKILLPEELSSFNPGTPVKRHEMAKYILRAMGKTEEALDHMDEDLPFNDAKAVPKDSVGYVYLINELGIMTGNNGTFRPMASLSRAELAIILDRADGTTALPDTSTRKNNISFVSFDEDANEITVQKNNTTYTYETVDNVPVYKNSSFGTVEDLVKGDVLQLVFNSDDEVIFIEVLKNAADVDDEDEIAISNVSYNSLPEILQDKVDDLKLDENYKAFEYNNYIYLFASMGEKKTGGYSIDIKNVYKSENDDAEYTVNAVVYTDEPSSSYTTQAITYPYDIVRFRESVNIENIVFLDEDGDELEEVEIVDLDAVREEESKVDYDVVDYDDLPDRVQEQVDYLKLNKNFKAYEYDDEVYLIATMGRKSTGGYSIDITDVYETEQSDGYYTIKAVVETDSPSLDENVSKDDTFPFCVVKFDYFNDIESVKFVDEDNDKLAEVKIVKLDEVTTMEGTIYSVTASSRVLKVQKSDGSVASFTVPGTAEIYINGEEESFYNLAKNMKVTVEITDERVTKVAAEDNITEVEGILTGINLGTSKKEITVKVGSSYKKYVVDSDVKVIIEDKEATLEQLTVNSELTLRFSNGLLIEIEK